MPSKPRLSRDAWADAALEALADGGPAAVAVEPLAARLGATKGSFYWHFTDRKALLSAALDQWEARTAAIATEVEGTTGGPQAQLARLLELAFAAATTSVDGVLLGATDDPLVAAAVERVTHARLDVLTRLYAAAGAADPGAEARYAYTAFLGLIALGRVAPAALPDVDAHVTGLAARLQPRS